MSNALVEFAVAVKSDGIAITWIPLPGLPSVPGEPASAEPYRTSLLTAWLRRQRV